MEKTVKKSINKHC